MPQLQTELPLFRTLLDQTELTGRARELAGARNAHEKLQRRRTIALYSAHEYM